MKIQPREISKPIIATQINNNASRTAQPLQEGEYVIMKYNPSPNDWYCADIRKILADRIEVNYYTTITPALADYKDASVKERSKNFKAATFLRTWCLDKGTGLPTTTPPLTNHGKLNHLW